MNRCLKLLFALLLTAPVTAFAGPGLSDLAQKNPDKSIAVVSLCANNFSNSLQGWNEANAGDLMSSRLNKMLEMTETKLGREWKLIKAGTFIAKPEFQALKGATMDVGLPKIGGVSLPLFCKARPELIKAKFDPEVAKQLCAITGADFILVIYSEWAVATGGFIPTSKALAKNVLTVFDKNGGVAFEGRVDEKGAKTLGSMGVVVVNDDTIDQWVDAYERGLNKLFKKK